MPWHLVYDDYFCALEICVEGVTGEEKIAMNAHDLSLELVTNVNLAVSIEAIQAIGNLVCGLRTHFTGCVRVLLPILEEKLKEKKPTLAEPLIQTLQSIQLRVAKTSISVLYTKGAKKGKRGDENAPEKQGRSENQKIEAESSCQSNKNAKEMKRIWVEAVKATCLTTWD